MDLASEVVPYVASAVAAYGGAVVAKARDKVVEEGSEATVTWGRRILGRLVASKRGTQVVEAVEELAEDTADQTSLDLLKAQIAKALAADADLTRDLARMIGEAGGNRFGQVRITGSSGFQIGSHNTQTNHFGTAGQ